MVTTTTIDGLVVIFAPAEIERERLTRALDTTAERIALICGGREVGRSVGWVESVE
jgi:DNA/RNA-binding domain of Phe-tRNA-synthetase-like protein